MTTAPTPAPDELLKLADEPMFVRKPRSGGYTFVTSPRFSGWSYMLSPRENDNSLYQSIAVFSDAERIAALRASAQRPTGGEVGDGTWQELMDLSARARARAHHHFLNTKTHDLLIECAVRLEELAPTTALASRSADTSEREVVGLTRQDIIDLIHNEYDPMPDLDNAAYPAFESTWDDGTGRIADAILAALPVASSRDV